MTGMVCGGKRGAGPEQRLDGQQGLVCPAEDLGLLTELGLRRWVGHREGSEGSVKDGFGGALGVHVWKESVVKKLLMSR